MRQGSATLLSGMRDENPSQMDVEETLDQRSSLGYPEWEKLLSRIDR